MKIRNYIRKYYEAGNTINESRNLAAEEIVLTKIAASKYKDKITLKGGILMFNLTKNQRRVTNDIDIDLIKFPISEKSIRELFIGLNKPNDYIVIYISGKPKELHHQDYHGLRIHTIIRDKENNSMNIKFDIGVNKYTKINQEKFVFCFIGRKEKILLLGNSTEQIFVEKTIAIAKFGPATTRYKDVYDIYYLIIHGLDNKKLVTIYNQYFKNIQFPKNLYDLENSIKETFENKHFINEISKTTNRWLDVNFDEIRNTIISFISKLE